MAGEKVIIQPKNGQAIWNGVKFIYTPNTGFAGKDSYVISKINFQNGLSETEVVNVEIPNLPPTANSISLTGYARDSVIKIDVTELISDPDKIILPVKLARVESIPSAFITFDDNIIYLVPKGSDAVETFKYYVSDGQNETEASITITLTGGVIQNIPQYIIDNIDDLGFKVNNVLTKKPDWDTSYTFVKANSSKLADLDVDRFNSSSSVVETNSGNWNQLYSKIPTYDGTITLVSTKSANWESTQPIVNGVRATVQTNSATWNSTNSILESNSAKWDTTQSSIQTLSSNFEAKKPFWDSSTSTVSSNSANWDVTSLRTSVQTSSGVWQNTYSTVSANSASWGALSYKTPIYDAAYNTLTSASGSWDDARNYVASNSSIWDIGSTVIASNSGRWLSGGSDLNFTSLNMTVCGDLVVAGSLTAQGATTQINANLVATSAFNIVNVGALDAMTVDKTLNQGSLAKFRSGGNTVMIVNSGRVGINTVTPNEALTVNGNISATGLILGNIPTEYTVFRSNSARYDSTFTYLTGASANLNALVFDKPKFDASSSYLTANSAAITLGLNSIKTLDDVRNVVQSQSADNVSGYNLLVSTSANIGKDALYQFNKLNYDSAVNYYQANSSEAVSINFIFDGSGRFLYSGSSGVVVIPSKVRIDSCSIYSSVDAGQDALMKIDILSATSTSYPIASSICNNAFATLTGVNISKSDPPTNTWKTIIDKGTILKFIATRSDGNLGFIMTRNATLVLRCTKVV